MPKPAKKARQRQHRQERAARLAAQRERKRRVVLAIIGLAVVLAVATSLFVGTSDNKKNDNAQKTAQKDKDKGQESNANSAECPNPDGSSPRTIDFKAPQKMCIDEAKTYNAIFDTSEGLVNVALDTKTTPKTTNNFVVLSRYHYYDNTTIFRTDPSIDIIQGGGPHTQSASDPGPGYYIPDEGGKFSYNAGDLVMARDSRGGGAQFFFGTGPNISRLNSSGNYVTFGKTATGLDVLQKIIGLHQATSDGLGGKPSKEVKINSVKIEEK